MNPTGGQTTWSVTNFAQVVEFRDPDYTPNAKERSLRFAIISTAALGLPITPAAVLGWTTVWTILAVFAAISGGYVALFYAVWLIGALEDLSSRYNPPPQLIGDDDFYAPPLYWPWGRYQARVRSMRRIRALERECNIRDAYPVG